MMKKPGRKNHDHNNKNLPKKYEPGFLGQLDRRTELFYRLNGSYQAIATDLGGESELSHVKGALVERFVFLEAVLTKLENDMATNPECSGELLGKWIQAINSLTGLAKTLGIERKLQSAPWMDAPNGAAK